MAIPRSDLIAYGIRNRVEAALGRSSESQDVEFKESADWPTLQWELVRTALAMANLRDGGLIIIGVSERNDRWELSGISADHLATYDSDTIITTVNLFASPQVELDAVCFEHEGMDFLVIAVKEFEHTPVVCKRDRDGTKLKNGAFFIRPFGSPRTSIVTEASQIHDLLELAAEKRARRIVETAARVGYVIPQRTPQDQYRTELEGI